MIIYLLTYYTLQISLHQFADGVAGKPSVGNDRIFDAHIGEFPALADLHVGTKSYLISIIVTFYEFLSHHVDESVTSPWPSGCHRNEFKRV